MEPAPPSPTRERIRQVAEEFYILRGHDGFSFGDIAAVVGTTRANVHHHFGNKRELMRELVETFADSAMQRIAAVWEAPGHTLVQRMNLQVQDLRRFYDRFNPEPGSRNVWSPISRLRLDLPVLGELGQEALGRVSAAYDRSLRLALDHAAGIGELRPEARAGDIVLLLRSTFLSCGPMTQDSGRFTDVEHLLDSLMRTILAAYGR